MPSANVTVKAIQGLDIPWNLVDWKKANEQVNNLRKRIYRACAEGDIKKVRNLQKLMIKSTANKLLAIRRVTQINRGKRTPGIDKIIVDSDVKRWDIFNKLSDMSTPESTPIKRVYISKKNGKLRPLGLPTIIDRCRQALVKSALEPYWEAIFESSSYGFRPGRSAHDAIERIFSIANPRCKRVWVLDADIKGAFDNIDHKYLLSRIGGFPAKNWIAKWLTSGVMEQNQLQATISGTPQGGIISPLLANIAFHGMEDVLGITHHEKGGVKTESEYNLVKYADDFVVFSKSEDTINKAKSLIVTWLKERGLELSEEKTKISNIKEGFDFLGFNIRQYETAYKKRKKVLLIKPSKSSVLSFKKQMTIEWKKMLGEKTENIIHKLNPKIIGWANYFCIGTSKETFSKLDHWMYIRQKRYAERRHLKEGQRCLKNRYWGTIKGRSDQWVFMDKKADRETYMWKLSWTKIRRHIIVKNQASPDNPKYSKYWEVRRKAHIPNLTNTIHGLTQRCNRLIRKSYKSLILFFAYLKLSKSIITVIHLASNLRGCALIKFGAQNN